MLRKTGAKKMKVLIVDDEQDILDSIGRILHPTKYDFNSTNDPLHAIELIRDDFYDAMILDVKMYPIDGITLLKRIREFNNSIYVILITAYEEYSILEEAVNLHIYSFIKKPIEVKKLINILREIEIKKKVLKHKEDEFAKIKINYDRLKKNFEKFSSGREDFKKKFSK